MQLRARANQAPKPSRSLIAPALTRRRALLVAAALLSAFTLAACSSDGSAPGPTSPQASASASVAAAKAKAARVGPTCPLTGLPPRKGQLASRVALAVKIDNVSEALPQAGDNRADVVVEELVEGGLTRLMAIFQCSTAPVVGPIRSARISDAYLLALLHGSVLGYSGANPSDLPPIEAHGDAVLISQDADGQYFYRSSSRAAPHNVFSSTSKILAAGIAQRHKLKAPKPMFRYGAIDHAAKPAHHVSITWPAATASWTWAKNRWLRTQDGSPDRVATGSQVSATNIVILSVDIASTGLHDVLGNSSPLDVTVGRNPVWVMRNGKMIKGTWRRPKVTSRLRLRDNHGHLIRLAPGRTWIELLPKPRTPSPS